MFFMYSCCLELPRLQESGPWPMFQRRSLGEEGSPTTDTATLLLLYCKYTNYDDDYGYFYYDDDPKLRTQWVLTH